MFITILHHMGKDYSLIYIKTNIKQCMQHLILILYICVYRGHRMKRNTINICQ